MDQRGRRINKSEILNFYRGQTSIVKPALTLPLSCMTLTNTGHGLGDTVILTDLPRAAKEAHETVSIFSQSPCFRTLVNYNPHFDEGVLPFWVAADRLCLHFNLGNGHIIQRLRRAFGFNVNLKPQGCIIVDGIERVPGRVIVHFEPGSHAVWQRKNIHPRAREIYPENLKIIENFARIHPELEFIEVGSTSSRLVSVRNCCGLSLRESIDLMKSAEYFVGILSGPLHLAAALELKIINIINFPAPDRIYLPTLKDIDQVESEWFYPQSVLLHQDGEGGTNYRFSEANLEKAFKGELYPYWENDYLELINELL